MQLQDVSFNPMLLLTPMSHVMFPCSSPPGDDRPFVKSGPFQFAQMCLRLCPNLVPLMEAIRRALNLDPSNEDHLSVRDFWGTIEGLLRVIRVFNQVSFTVTIYLLSESVIKIHMMQRKELSFSQELTKRCNLMLQSRLSRIADSPEKVRYVQVLITLHCGFPRVASSTECREWPVLLSFMKLAFGVFPEIDDTLGIHHCLESAETLEFLEHFQLDSACSGIFYIDAEVQHAFVTTGLIRSFSSHR